MKISISCDDLRLVVASIDALRDQIKCSDQKDTKERLAELEIKMSKLWQLLTSQTPLSGETKLSKAGKRFGLLLQGGNTRPAPPNIHS